MGDPGSIPWSGRSPGEGNGNPLQYSCLENPMKEEPGRLQSMGSQRIRHDWSTLLQTKWNGSTEYEIENVNIDKLDKSRRSSYSPVVFKYMTAY